MVENYIIYAKILETNYGVNIKRFCYHLNKRGKTNFLSDYSKDKNSFEVQQEIEKANKVLKCNIEIMLEILVERIQQENYNEFIKTMACLYKKEKIMFIS